jgi:hypothetical protein
MCDFFQNEEAPAYFIFFQLGTLLSIKFSTEIQSFREKNNKSKESKGKQKENKVQRTPVGKPAV